MALCAVAAACPVFCQPALEASADRQRQIVETIDQEQSDNGPYSLELIGPLAALALFYQEQEDHDLAIVAVERARQVVRVNYGLHSIEEAPLLQQLIRSQEALGDVEMAWEIEQNLLTLARRYPNDLRTAPIWDEVADKREDVLERYIAGDFPPQMVLGCYYWSRGNPRCHSGSRGQAIRALSDEVDRYRVAALRVERWARGCERPRVPNIVDKKELTRSEERTIEKDVHMHLEAMADYVGCVQAQYEAAVRAKAPASQLSRLQSERMAAIAAMEDVMVTFKERIRSIPYSLETLLRRFAAPSSISRFEALTRFSMSMPRMRAVKQ
jgi:tetratricopeptide (TPR) repeat protein